MRTLQARHEEYPPTAQAWYCVTILALVVMVNFLDRGILTLLVEPIKADLGLSDVQMSLVMGFAFTFFYAIFGLPVARLVDRHSRKHILAAGVAIWSLMTAFCGLAGNFWQLFLQRASAWASARRPAARRPIHCCPTTFRPRNSREPSRE